MWLGFDYISSDEEATVCSARRRTLIDLFDPADVRLALVDLRRTRGRDLGLKFPTTTGAEDFHVIRLAEVLLIKAEALARQNDLAGAVDTYNPIRVRAGCAPHTLGNEVTTQEDVLAAIDLERQARAGVRGGPLAGPGSHRSGGGRARDSRHADPVSGSAPGDHRRSGHHPESGISRRIMTLSRRSS